MAQTMQTMQTGRVELCELDRRIINRLQEGFPLVMQPYMAVAGELGCTEEELIARLQRLRDTGILTRFGPFFDVEAMGGAFCLCAMAVPAERFEVVTDLVNAHAEVAHNYQRDHALNMWFVLATESADDIERVARQIEAETGLEALLFPKLEEFFIGFKVAA
jgi:DNA-binding Lrp family transcriptional regulator